MTVISIVGETMCIGFRIFNIFIHCKNTDMSLYVTCGRCGTNCEADRGIVFLVDEPYDCL